MSARRESANINKEQKIGFVLLLIFAVLAIVLGVVQIRNTMYKPFALSNKVPPLSDAVTKNINHLRYRDTDKDGINDFDELYTYQTSPYLEDTDSDGVTDGQEITRGSNPLCFGNNCVGVAASKSNKSGSGATSSVQVSISSPGQAPPNLAKALQDPVQLRAMLLSSGVQASVLDSVTDIQLVSLVNQIMNPASSTGSNLGSIYPNVKTATNTKQ